MKTCKKSQISLLMEVLLILAIGFIIWYIISGGVNKAAGSVLNPLKEKLGMGKEDSEKQKESERVANELLKNAESAYMQFSTMMNNCLIEHSNDKSCVCGSIDFTRLNEYSLALANDMGNQHLELRDSKQVPLKGTGIGRFLILSTYSGPPPTDGMFDELSDYSKRLIYILFSKGSIKFILSDNSIEMSSGKTQKIFFRKLTKNVLVIDESDLGIRKCGLQ